MRPSGAGSVNSGARSPTFSARSAWPLAIRSAVAFPVIARISGGRLLANSALKASSLSCNDILSPV